MRAEIFPSRMWEGNSVNKRVDKDTVTLTPLERNLQQDDLTVLGVEYQEWREGESVTFHSSYATTRVNLH